ncbi:MAG: hypothetical protein QXW44_01150 [Pyrobaculum sp.]|jgi:archaellum component FlaC
MAIDFGYPDYVVEILNELKELRREVTRLQREVAELSKKISQQETTPREIDTAISALREGVEKLNAAAAAVVENIALARATVAEERLRRDEACMAVLEKLLALQEILNKQRNL